MHWFRRRCTDCHVFKRSQRTQKLTSLSAREFRAVKDSRVKTWSRSDAQLFVLWLLPGVSALLVSALPVHLTSFSPVLSLQTKWVMNSESDFDFWFDDFCLAFTDFSGWLDDKYRDFKKKWDAVILKDSTHVGVEWNWWFLLISYQWYSDSKLSQNKTMFSQLCDLNYSTKWLKVSS